VLHDCVAVSPNVVPDGALKLPLTTVRFPQSGHEKKFSYLKAKKQK
jgi:hypothetical protein